MEKHRRGGQWRRLGSGLARLMGVGARENATPTPTPTPTNRSGDNIVVFTGVSVSWLVSFWGDVRAGRVGGDVEIVVAKVQLADDVWAGRSMDANGRVPYRQSGEAQRFTAAQVTRKAREDWSISDVCDFVIIPFVMARKCIFADTLSEEDVGAPFQGAFVSQARSSRFDDLVAALVRHFSSTSSSDRVSDAFVWLDLFCANQPLLTNKGAGVTDDVMKERAALLTKGFHEAIERFDERLFFFDSWEAPAPLSRMWCIWELFGGVKSGKPIKLIFAPGEEDKFVDTLLDPKNILDYIAMMQPAHAQCFDADDLAMIRAAVETTVGWPELKRTVLEQLNKWMLLETEAALAKVAAEPGSAASEGFGALLTRAGDFVANLGKLERAAHLYQEALAVLEEAHGTEQHPAVAKTWNNSAIVLAKQGDLDGALEAYRRCIELHAAWAADSDDPEMASEAHVALEARTKANMASIYMRQGLLDKALQTYLEAESAYEESDSEGDAAGGDRGVLWAGVGALYRLQGELDKALDAFERSVRAKVEHFGTEEHVSVAESLNGQANVHMARGAPGDLQAALRLYRRSFDIFTAAYGTDEHASCAMCCTNAGLAHSALGDLDAALQEHQRALDIILAVYGPEGASEGQGQGPGRRAEEPHVPKALDMLGQVFEARGELDEALRAYERSSRASGDAKHQAIMASKVGYVHEQRGELAEARLAYEQCFALNEASGKRQECVSALSNLATVHKKQGDLELAVATLERSLALSVELHGAESDNAAQAAVLFNLGTTLAAHGDMARALQCLERSYNAHSAAYGADHPLSVNSLLEMSKAHEALGNIDDALAGAEQVLHVYEKHLPDDHPFVAAAQQRVRDLATPV